MNKSQFRLGNLCVDQLTGELLKVMHISDEDDGLGFYVVNRGKYPLPKGWQAVPIPISAEWFERMGFERVEDFVRITYRKDNIYLRYYGNWVLENDIGVSLYNVRIYAVHQVQNLYFALTGTELEIKEPQQANQ